MRLLNLKEQRDIVTVIDYLVETHQKNNTVGDVLKMFSLTPDEYRMCCNLAMPALRLGNMKGRFAAARCANKAMRKDIKDLYERVKAEQSEGADAIRRLYETYCTHKTNVVYGSAKDAEVEDTGDEA